MRSVRNERSKRMILGHTMWAIQPSTSPITSFWSSRHLKSFKLVLFTTEDRPLTTYYLPTYLCICVQESPDDCTPLLGTTLSLSHTAHNSYSPRYTQTQTDLHRPFKLVYAHKYTRAHSHNTHTHAHMHTGQRMSPPTVASSTTSGFSLSIYHLLSI